MDGHPVDKGVPGDPGEPSKEGQGAEKSKERADDSLTGNSAALRTDDDFRRIAELSVNVMLGVPIHELFVAGVLPRVSRGPRVTGRAVVARRVNDVSHGEPQKRE